MLTVEDSVLLAEWCGLSIVPDGDGLMWDDDEGQRLYLPSGNNAYAADLPAYWDSDDGTMRLVRKMQESFAEFSSKDDDVPEYQALNEALNGRWLDLTPEAVIEAALKIARERG